MRAAAATMAALAAAMDSLEPRAHPRVALEVGVETDDARDEGGEDGDEVVLLDAARHVACGCPRQDEECIDDEDADPLDADGNDDGEQGGKRRLDAHDGDAAAVRE